MRGNARVRRHGGFLDIVILFSTVLAVEMVGCSSAEEATVETNGVDQATTQNREFEHDKAVQHFVDGSLYELKGEYAKAVLEYQDALRYEENHAIYFALSKSYSHLNKHSLAIDAGKEAVRLAPDKLEYRRSLAEVYAAAFEMDSAAVEYEEIVKRDSNNIDSWYNLARLYQSRKPLKALEVYEQITKRFGDEWDVLVRIAELYSSMGQVEKAISTMQKMTAIDPGNVELKRTLAQTLVRAQQYDGALAIYTDLRELDPDNLDYLGEVATVLLLKKEYSKAAELYDLILERDSVSIDVKLRIGEVYFAQLEKDSTLIPLAQALFERIRDKHAGDWRPYWFLGAIGAISKNDSLSVPNFRKVTELASWNADGWVYLSSVFMQENKYQEVVTVLESAINVLPDDFQVNLYLGVAYYRLGRNADAVQVLEHAREIDSKDMRAITQLALVYDGMMMYEESDKIYEEALKIDPNNHLVLNNYGYSLADRGLELERCFEMAKKAVEAQPDNPAYLDTIGWIYYRLSEYEDAAKYVEMAIEKGEVNAVVHEHLGDIYYMLDDKEQALVQWKRALELDGDNSALRDKIARGTL